MLSTYLRNAILNAIGNNAPLQVAQAYASLHSADPGLTGANELANSNGYARVAANFGAAGSGIMENDGVVTFGPATPAGWSAATHLGIWDSGTYGAGNFLYSIKLGGFATPIATWMAAYDAYLRGDGADPGTAPAFTAAPKTCGIGDTASFAIGAMDLYER